MSEEFSVKQTVKLSEEEKLKILCNEALFFYHSWIRSDFELIEIAHDMLLDLSNYDGLIANYKDTKECETIESLRKQSDKLDEDCKIRLNGRSGKFEWLNTEFLPEIYNDLIWQLSQFITESYGLDNYFCGYIDGNWGLWPNSEDDY